MIELFFVACLYTQPDQCQQRSLLYAEGISPMTCMMGAQPQLAEWANTHPGWAVSSWKCRVLDRQLAETDA